MEMINHEESNYLYIQKTPGITNFEGNPKKVRYIGSSLNRELSVHRKTIDYCSQTIYRGADKDESLFLIVRTQCKCTKFLKASKDSKGMLRNY